MATPDGLMLQAGPYYKQEFAKTLKMEVESRAMRYHVTYRSRQIKHQVGQSQWSRPARARIDCPLY